MYLHHSPAIFLESISKAASLYSLADFPTRLPRNKTDFGIKSIDVDINPLTRISEAA
jgi:hypothetical protein